MTLVLMLVIMTVAMGLTLVAIGRLVRPDPKPAWQRGLERGFRAATGRDRPAPQEPPDPIELLRIQERLGVLAGQIQSLQGPSYAAASAHRLVALRAAYDDLLEQGCELAGVPPLAGVPRGEERRSYEEQALTERGWSW